VIQHIRQIIHDLQQGLSRKLQQGDRHLKAMTDQVLHSTGQRLYGRSVSLEELHHLQRSLLDEASLDSNYLVLTVGACAIATFGLLANSAAVIIGAMIVAPLMLPIRCMAFGILEGEPKLIRQGLISVSMGTAISVFLAMVIGQTSGLVSYGSEVFARSQPNLLDLGVAIFAGGISGFAKVRPKISSALAGTAIAVALMPPICVVGLGIARANWNLSTGAGILYITNLLGITLSCMVAFLVTGYTPIMQARRGLGLALALTSILLVPLGVSFFRLVRQTELEASLRKALIDRTITFQRVQLVSSETNWLTQPPEVRMVVITRDPVTPKQVRLLEEFLTREMGRPFKLIFEITQVEEVQRERRLPGGGR
jgi:uncharacterized hydrophobic protein (TIGR00271 family)